ncbi:MAG: hypothetical protein H6757_03395 [Candidatus Omnitrophica bacterium]|nr:hypothetical protein [Candidatus Omnitrophota bacterium]
MSTNNLRVKLTAFLLAGLLWAPPSFAYTPSAKEKEVLLQIQKDSAGYFIRMSDKMTGLTRDSSQTGSPASIAATGFALAAVAVAGAHSWVDPDYAKKQIEKTLSSALHKVEHKNGFFYHFVDGRTGKRVWGSEASSIDTALFLAGALVAAQYYPGTSIDHMAHQIYERIDWQWMMNGSDLICMGWKPESGFLPYYWDSYNELIILQALAIGAPKRPVPPKAWDAWFRNEDSYNDKNIIFSYSGSLFTYQYSQAFIDFRNLWDVDINYFENSRLATLANFEYSQSFQNQHKGYSANSWGLSASLGPGGYKAYGALPGEGLHDGTIAPYAAIASIVFTPAESIAASLFFYENYHEKLYGHFGFKDAFNLDKHWWSDQYLGIDQGIIVLMLENFLNQNVIWNKFMQLDAIQRWIQLTNLKTTSP